MNMGLTWKGWCTKQMKASDMKSKTLNKRRAAVLSAGLVLFIIAFILLTLPGSGIKPSSIHEITIQDSSGNTTRIRERKEINQIVDALNRKACTG
jgi:hypothetical protein